MGLRFKKSFTIGGIKITASKSGISHSFGGKGFRITKKANGKITTTASIPNTGISYTNTYSKSKTKATSTSDVKLTLIKWISITAIIIIIGIILLCSYIQTSQHDKWVKEEKARHSIETDFAFIDTPTMTYEQHITNNTYRYIISGRLKNISGYTVYTVRIYFTFYDENNNILTTSNYFIGDIEIDCDRQFKITTYKYFSVKAHRAKVSNITYSIGIS